MDFAVDEPALFRLMFGQNPRISAHEEVAGEGKKCFTFVIEEVAAHVMRHQRPLDPLMTAVQLWTVVHGAACLRIEGNYEKVAPGVDVDAMIAQAGRRILDGEIRRGMLDVISAVILVADLRGFTAIADRSEREVLIETLNDYFDCQVPVIVAHGGHVLKFLGDGLLATFPLAGRAPEAVCDVALGAAAEVLRGVRELGEKRAEAGKPVMDLDIALHLGEVFYGNVGSADRLDFTVIGPAVNEASRIEALCAQHDRNLLLSEAFARAASNAADRLISIGRYGLRGVRSAQSIYALDGH